MLLGVRATSASISVNKGFEHAPKFINLKNVDKFSLRSQAKPTNSFDNFFSEVVKARPGPKKNRDQQYPRYIYCSPSLALMERKSTTLGAEKQIKREKSNAVPPSAVNRKPSTVKVLLDEAALRYNTTDFIESDPISIPHRFSGLQDREIMGFWAATLAWGQRKTIIQNASRLAELMDNAPFDFIRNHEELDRKRFLDFKHRTFQAMDTLWFLEFLQQYYQQHHSLETAFARHLKLGDQTVENALRGFHDDFFADPDAPTRTRKHVATPARGSTCKRLNMFLRWMVRKDNTGVDFGLWTGISPSQLLIPLDVHVERVARRMGLLQRKQTDWKSVLELTENLRAFDPNDPVKYDFALFGLGVLEKDLWRK